MKSSILNFSIFIFLLFCGSLFSQEKSARLTIKRIEGYKFSTVIKATLLTTKAKQQEGVLISDNVDIHILPSANPQSEIHASINKTNPQNILISSNTAFGLSNNSIQGWYVTTDGGQTWFGGDVLPNNGLGRGDPSTAFDALGNAYIASMAPNAIEDPDGWMVQKSTNQGFNWSSSKRATGPTAGFDKEMIASDNLSNSPYANYLYCAWTEFIGGNGTLSYASVKINRSIDGGQIFFSPITLRESNNGTGGGQGTSIATGPNGEVYICWADYSTGAVPANGMGFAKSTNGGTSYTSNVVFSYQGIRNNGVDPRFNNTRVNDFPSIGVDKSNGTYRGRIYIVYPNGGNGTNDQSVIQMRFSTDNGTSWSNVKTISTPSGRQNWFPWVAVDDLTGDISVIYYSLDSPSGFSTNTYVAHSSDGGTTWENIKVSDVSHITAPIPGFVGGYAGDYLGICAYGGRAYPAWSDDRNGTWQIYTSPIIYNLPVAVLQNYGNGSQVTGSTIGRWNGSSFASIEPGSTLTFEVETTEVLRGDQSIYNGQKYNVWKKFNDPENDVVNQHLFPVTTIFPNQLTSQFALTYSGITIQNYSLEGNVQIGDSIQFKDPWLIDYPDPLYGNNVRNQGMNAPFKTRTSPFNPGYTTSFSGDVYKGVFLNENPNFLPDLPNYSVKAQSPQNINLGGSLGTHKFYFQNWEASNNGADASFQNANLAETPVVFNNAGATVTANMKGTQLSNNINAYKNSSQRKIVKTDNGNLHMVYESMSKVWYERSTDDGATWSIMNSGQPLSSYNAKLPSIDYGDGANNKIAIVYQEENGYYSKIQLKLFSNGSFWTSNVIYSGYSVDYSADAFPVVAV